MSLIFLTIVSHDFPNTMIKIDVSHDFSLNSSYMFIYVLFVQFKLFHIVHIVFHILYSSHVFFSTCSTFFPLRPVQEWFSGVDGLGLCAEHGFHRWPPRTLACDMHAAWRRVVDAVDGDIPSGKPWENHGKMGKRENHRKTIGKWRFTLW